jgi:periplasmic protein TonB
MSDPDLDQKASRPLWVIAAVTALALHLGGAALAFASLRANEGDEGLGAAGAEFAVELASPKVPEDELPPGPDSDQSPQQEEIKQQKAEAEDTELPKDRPLEAEDPDRIVTTSDTKKPKEDEAKIAALETKAQDYSQAQEASSRKQLDENARESQTARAPNPGVGKDRLKLTADWGRKISAYFDLHKKYPENKKGKRANVKVSLVLNRRGNVVSVDVVQSSGDTAFDAAALAMIHRSDPVPLPPAGLTEDTFSFSLDVNFKEGK